MSSIDYNDIRYDYNTDFIVNTTSLLGNVIKYLLIGIGVVIAVVVGILLGTKKKKNTKLTKEDKYKFIDMNIDKYMN